MVLNRSSRGNENAELSPEKCEDGRNGFPGKAVLRLHRRHNKNIAGDLECFFAKDMPARFPALRISNP